MRVVGTLIFSIAVLMNYIACISVREQKPSGHVRALPGYRHFVALPDDIPDLYTKLRNGPLIPVLGPLTVLAKDDYILGWMDKNTVHPIYNYEGDKVIKHIRSGANHIMTYPNVELSHPSKIFPLIEQAILYHSKSLRSPSRD